MARGDVKVGINTLGASANWTVQPPAGEEWALMEVGGPWTGTDPNKAQNVNVKLSNGSGESYVRLAGQLIQPLRGVIITNSIYLVLQNASGGTASVAYGAMQVK